MQKLVLLDVFGKKDTIEAEIIKEETRGYNLKSGAWGLYPDKDGSSTPAKFTTFRKKRHTRCHVINNKKIVKAT